MVPRIGCTTSLESNYYKGVLRPWGELGVVCNYLHRWVGIVVYICIYAMEMVLRIG